MDGRSKEFRVELAGLVLASMSGAVVRDSIRTVVVKGRESKADVDLERAARLLKGLPALALAAADELLARA